MNSQVSLYRDCSSGVGTHRCRIIVPTRDAVASRQVGRFDLVDVDEPYARYVGATVLVILQVESMKILQVSKSHYKICLNDTI